MTWTITIVTWLVILLGIIFTVIEPLSIHDYYTAFWTVIGPIFFALVAWIFYEVSVKQRKINVPHIDDID